MPKERKSSQAKQESASGLVVTAQQSRFHVDASDAPNSKEIDVKDLGVTIGGREIVTHAELKLRENVHYVLVGRNGTGKSTLLRALGENRIPGVPWNLRMLLLGQTNLVSSGLESQAISTQYTDGSVLDHVIRSDVRRERASRELDLLTNALENANEPMAVVRTSRKIRHGRLEYKLAEMKEIATRRSGARGAKARKDLIAMEERVALSAGLLEQPECDIDPTMMQNETSMAVDALSEIHALLEGMDASKAEVRARTILKGLRFSKDVIDQPFTNLSGGWRTRCDLACALFQKVDILLLDECTNFLDLPAVIWLEKYIQTLDDTTVVVITHDRDFADAVADELLILREGNLHHFRGNLSAYEAEQHSQRMYMTRMKDAQDKKTKHMEDTIDANIRSAKRTGDDKKLKQAASRRKKIEERTGLEVGLRGGRFKLNRDLPGYHLTNRDAIEIPTLDPPVRISIPSSPPSLRFPGALVSLKGVSFSYPRSTKQPILRDIDLVIHPGERIGVAGLNGVGKSTLVGLVVGKDEDPGGSSHIGSTGLLPTKGTVTRHSRSRIRCFSQHAIEALEAKGINDKSLTALSELIATAAGELTESDARALLGSLGLPGRTASDVPVAALSGGQKVRLALAKLIYIPPHLLVLDEVTTHLDSSTILALIEALQQYEGALMIITHDRFFMRCVVEGESPYDDSVDVGDDEDSERNASWTAKPGVVYHLAKGELKALEGGMRKYETIASKSSSKVPLAST